MGEELRSEGGELARRNADPLIDYRQKSGGACAARLLTLHPIEMARSGIIAAVCVRGGRRPWWLEPARAPQRRAAGRGAGLPQEAEQAAPRPRAVAMDAPREAEPDVPRLPAATMDALQEAEPDVPPP
jgi:hypothetical protein